MVLSKRNVISLFFFLVIGIFSTHAKKLNILYIGNSYTAVNNLPQMIADLSLTMGDTTTFTAHTPGGATANNHWSNNSLHTMISLGNWDVVVLQCQSQEPSFSPSQVQSDTYPYVGLLDSLIQATQSCAETMLYMTWGRKNGDASNCPFYPPICTYNGMQQRLRESYMQFAQDFGTSLSPVGVAWKTVRDSFPTIELYNPDESHPSIAGSYLAACVFYVSLFHKAIVNSPYLPAGMLQGDAIVLQNIASKTVLDSIENWQQFGQMPLASFANTTTGLDVQFANNSKRYTSSQWDFGDGMQSNLPQPAHTYTTDGSYEVCLTVSSACGKTSQFCDSVTVKKPDATIDIIKQPLSIYVANKSIHIPGNTLEMPYVIFDMAGHKVQQGRCINNISLYNLAQGMYILKLNEQIKPIPFTIQ
ncbi:MAG: PKD domain-containing protein [Chitinophagaceae bacterium]